MRLLVAILFLTSLAGFSPAKAMDMDFAQAVMRDAIGDTTGTKVSDEMVRTMLRGALEQHGNMSLVTQNFASVESMHDKLQEKGFRLADGDLAEVAYLDDLKAYVLGVFAPEFVYPNWARKSPQSALPRLIYASTRLSQAAEMKRASIYVPTADQYAPADMEVIAATRKYLLLNKDVAAKSGYWYNLMIEIAILEGSTADDVKGIVGEGLAAFPDNVQLAVLGSTYFLPKWHGSAEALEDYAIWVSDRVELKDRQDVYAQIYAKAIKNHYGLTLFKFATKNWSRMKPSIRKLVANYPGEKNSNMAAVLACLGGDRELTRELVIRREVVQSSNAYWMDKDAYNLCFNWAVTSQ